MKRIAVLFCVLLFAVAPAQADKRANFTLQQDNKLQ